MQEKCLPIYHLKKPWTSFILGVKCSQIRKQNYGSWWTKFEFVGTSRQQVDFDKNDHISKIWSRLRNQ